jgi:predicted kinase
MKKVIMSRGLPSSGKTTWAKEMVTNNPNTYKRINNDDLRKMLDNNHYSKDTEKFIKKAVDALVLLALEEGKHVILDNTHLTDKSINRIKELVKGKAEVVIEDKFLQVPLETCIKNDLKRLESVGKDVIVDMYNKHVKKNEHIIQDVNLPKAIIVDIDGTLAHMNNRSPFDWQRVGEDTCDETIKNIVNNYSLTNKVIVMSGRDSSCRELTEKWLVDNGIVFNELYMRSENDNRKDSIVKKELFDDNIKDKYFIEYVLDDRLQVCRLWFNMGLTLLRVGNPDSNF